ncbi:MAG: hypothetical protein KDC26_09680 [Armatimonadetes bacterium]|nr:hypothetical protein [Armatimonadota bacterium]
MAKPVAQFSQEPLTNRRIWFIYFPLALSWLFMAIEAPTSMAVLGLKPNITVNNAAMLLLFAIAIFIESPVIDLLSTSTTLGTTRERWQSLSQFAWFMMGVVTITHAGVMFTPLYDAVVELMKAKPEVADAAKLPLQIMTPWSALVGWRRYLQGIMIKQGVTRPISVGTLVRVLMIALVGFGLAFTTQLNGLVIVAIGLICSVGSEAMFIHFASRPVIAKLPSDPDSHMSVKQLSAFHFPLTASTMLMLTTPVIIASALNRAPSPLIASAAWQVAGSLIWIFRSMTFALPEAVISLYDPGAGKKLLLRFCMIVGGVLSLTMIVFHFAGIDYLVFRHIYNAESEPAQMAKIAILSCVAMPIVNALMSYYRGALTAHHITWARIIGIAVGLVSLLVGLGVGIKLGWLGVIYAGIGSTFAVLMEATALGVCYRIWSKNDAKKQARLDAIAEPCPPVNLGVGGGATDPAPVLSPDCDD